MKITNLFSRKKREIPIHSLPFPQELVTLTENGFVDKAAILLGQKENQIIQFPFPTRQTQSKQILKSFGNVWFPKTSMIMNWPLSLL